MLKSKNFYNRILVVRTDRVGDVVLSTPVLEALRVNYPSAKIAMMVTPQTKELVQDNPNLDEIIIYDKDKKDKGVLGFWKFIWTLRKQKFDLAVVLHTKKRTNLITYLAGISRRAGYKNSKFGFLLTDKIADTRALGLKHEVDYCLDILKNLGLPVKSALPVVSLRPDALEQVERLLREHNIHRGDKIALLHPGASCVSKRWMKERFAQVADGLAQHYGFKIIIVGAKEDYLTAEYIVRHGIHGKAVNLTGKTSLAQVTALIKLSSIFISNDSGPVHIAAALNIPVVSIFGRNQAGLSPARWRPLGPKARYLHKKTDCNLCLAHNCKIGFTCLKAVTVEDVLKEVDDLLKL